MHVNVSIVRRNRLLYFLLEDARHLNRKIQLKGPARILESYDLVLKAGLYLMDTGFRVKN